MMATVDTTENRSKKNSKEKKNYRCDSGLLHIDEERIEGKRNLRIKKDNINIGEQFYAMPSMLPSSGSWNYAQEKNRPFPLFLFSLSLSFSLSVAILILLSHAGMQLCTSSTIDINRRMMIWFKRQINLD
jgi:hypothetical protein